MSKETNAEQTQLKQVEDTRVSVLVPLSMVATPAQLPPPNYRCWARTMRADDWVGLIPVALRHVQLDPVMPRQPPVPNPDGTIPPPQQLPVTGMATYVALNGQSGGLDGAPMDERHLGAARLEQIFCDIGALAVGTTTVFEETSWGNVSEI